MICVLMIKSTDGQWMPFFQRIIIKGWVLKLNEDPVREMTIFHPPQHEERILGTLSCPRNPTLVA